MSISHGKPKQEKDDEIDQMITRHASCGNYKINYLGVKCMYYLTLSILQDMIRLGAIAIQKRYFMKALEIGKVILNVSTQLLSLAIFPTAESSRVDEYTSFVNVRIPPPDSEFVQTIEKISSWKIFLIMFFQLLI